MSDRRKTLIKFLLKFMSSQQDLNFPRRIQDGCPSSTLNSKESFGIAKITEEFRVSGLGFRVTENRSFFR